MTRKGIELDSVGTLREAMSSQYQTSANLRSRVSIYRYLDPEKELTSRFDTWVLDHLEWRGDETVADVGCGPGPYLRELGRRAQAIVAIDLSVGMLTEARSASREVSGITHVVAEAQQLPLRDSCIDVLLAAHMLYHVHDIETTLAAFRRVIKSRGVLLVVLNGENDKSELRSVWEEAGIATLGDRFHAPRWSARANLDNAPERIAAHFSSVTVDRLPGIFRFPGADSPVTWIESLRNGTEALLSDDEWDAVVAETRSRIELLVDRDGEFRVTKDSGVVVAVG